jgi:predicted Zn-dependent peptidase
MMRIGKNELVHDRVIPIEEIMGQIQEITLSDLHETAQYLFGQGYTQAQVGPFDEKDKAAAQMESEENQAMEAQVFAA